MFHHPHDDSSVQGADDRMDRWEVAEGTVVGHQLERVAVDLGVGSEPMSGQGINDRVQGGTGRTTWIRSKGFSHLGTVVASDVLGYGC